MKKNTFIATFIILIILTPQISYASIWDAFTDPIGEAIKFLVINLVSAITDIFAAIINLFPNSDGLPEYFAKGIYYIVDFGDQLSFIIPWQTLFLFFIFGISFQITLLVWGIIKWIIDYIRGR